MDYVKVLESNNKLLNYILCVISKGCYLLIKANNVF